MHWKRVKEDGPPPFHRLCVVKGRGDDSRPAYAIAYNQLFQGEGMILSQKLPLPEGHHVFREDGRCPSEPQILIGVPFEVEEWCELD